MEKQRRSQITIKGADVDAKFAHVEVILKRLARRMNQKVIGIIPPSIIFYSVEAPDKDGVLLRGVLPAGELTKICIVIRKYNTKKAVKFLCKIESRLGHGNHYIFETHKELVIEDLNLTLPDIGFFTISIDQPVEGDQPIIEDIWITALFQANQSESRIKEIMLDELIKLEDLDEGI